MASTAKGFSAHRMALMVSTSLLSMGVYGHLRSARAANDCGVIAAGGTAICTLSGNNYTGGIDYDVTDATVVLQDGVVVSTTANDTPGVISGALAGSYGDLAVTTEGTVSITTTGDNSYGIGVGTDNGSVTVETSADTTIRTEGSLAPGIAAIADGTDNITVTAGGAITTTGANSNGIFAFHQGSGDISITGNTVTQTGTSASAGVYAVALGGGDIDVTMSGVSSANGYGIYAIALAGTVDITATGPVTAARSAIVASSGSSGITIDAQDQVTSYSNGPAVLAYSPSGNISVTTSGISALSGYGIIAYGGSGTVNLTATGAVTSEYAAMVAETTTGNITLTAQDQLTSSTSATSTVYAGSISGEILITSNGISNDQGNGIYADSLIGDITITDSDTVSTLGDGISAFTAEADIIVNAQDVVTTLGDGIYTYAGITSTVTVSGDVTAGDDGINAFGTVGSTVTSHGNIVAGDEGIEASSTFGPVTVTANNVTATGADNDAISVYSGSTVVITLSGNVLGGAGGPSGNGIDIDNSTTGTINVESGATVGAMSDFAITNSGGALTINNEGTITGSIEMGDNDDVLNNLSSNSVNLRRFTDTNADGIRDTEAVAILDFGAGNDTFDNAATGALRLSNVTGATAFDTTNETFATGSAGLSLTNEGVEQGHLLELETFINSGLISMADADTGGTGPVAGDVLVITSLTAPGTGGTSNFISNGGELHLDTQLDDGAVDTTDVLILDTATTGAGGATGITVTNAGGAGGITGTGATDGIRVVEVRGGSSASDAFELGQAVVGGIYEYKLNQADGQNWYLQSDGTLAIQIPTYRVLPLSLAGFVRDQMPWAQKRWGHVDGLETVESGAWTRGVRTKGEAETDASDNFETRNRFVQAGYDIAVNGELSIGGMAEYAWTDTEMRGGNGSDFSADGFGAGLSAFWSPEGGFFLEVITTLNQWDIEVDRPLFSNVATTDALSFSAGLQVGHQFKLSDGPEDRWTVTPRAALSYVESDIDSFVDGTGLIVDFTDGDSMLLEAGMISGLDLDLKGNRVLSLTAELGIEQEIGGTMGHTANGIGFSTARDKTRATFGAGATLDLGDEFSLFARASGATPFSGDDYQVDGTVGLRIAF